MRKPLDKINWKSLAEDLQKKLFEIQTMKTYWENTASRHVERIRKQEDEIDRLRYDQAIDEATLIKQRERLIKLTGIKNRCGGVMQAVRQIFYEKQSTYELTGAEWKRVWSQVIHLRMLEISMLALDKEIASLEVDDAIPQAQKKSA